MKLKKTIGAMALTTMFVAMSASAVEKNITVTASVDPTIDILQADGSSLPTAVELTYSPAASRFENYKIATKVHTNVINKNVLVKLVNDPKLTNVLDSTKQLPITVSYGGKTLSTADVTFEPAELNFGTSGVTGVSSSQDLVIGATTAQAPTAGNYSGVVSILMTLAS